MSTKPRARKSKTAVAGVSVPDVPVEEPTVQITEQFVEAPILSIVEEKPVKEKKPRASKKTPPVVAIVTPSGITGSFLSEQRPLIAHLPVKTSAINFDLTNATTYNSTPAEPAKAYDAKNDNMSYLDGVQEGACVDSDDVMIVKQSDKNEAPVTKCKLPSHYSEKLMVLFQDSNRYNKLPTSTEIACFWCCHSFCGAPVAIPSHILDEIWYMYGNFCSPECATAYLFKERVDNHAQWERYALLNSLYAEDAAIPAGSPRGIRPAPPREVLRMFGGSMDISEYRAVVHEKRLRIDVLTPPMVSIIQTMDTKPIDFYDQNLKNVFIRNDIQHKYNAPGAQGLRLRRSKPVKSRESTVEWAMQIQHITA